MRTIVMLMIVSLFFSCSSAGRYGQDGTVVQASADSFYPAIPSVEEEVSVNSVGEALKFLSADKLAGRESGTEGGEKAGTYIVRYFESIGLKPFYPDYRDVFEHTGVPMANVVGYLEGNDPELRKEFVVLGAHYDHIGFVDPVNGDSIANGANDNATGTVTVMEIARKMALRKSNKRSVIFALFAAEEKGLVGSRHLAKRMKAEGVKFCSMMNFEMVGIPMNREYMAYVTGYDLSTMAENINKYAGEEVVGLLPEAKEYSLFRRSDNYPFYEEFGLPAHTFSTFDFTNYGYYHQPDDEFELMDLKHMVVFIDRMIPLVEGVVNSDSGSVRMVGENTSD